MPYKIYKENDSYCIHKEKDDGSKGELIKCHNSEEKANAQLKALWASETGKSMTIEVTEVENVTDVDTTTKAVAMKGRYYEDFIDDVHDAWREKFDYSGWVIKVGEKNFIAQKDKSFWEVPYSRDENNSVTIAPLNEWTEVKRGSDFVKKNAHYLTAVKAISEDTIGAYGMLWGDSENKDYHDEYFTSKTAEIKSVFEGMGAIPLLFDHGVDKTIKSTVLGKVTTMEEDEIGLWFEAKITEHELYKKMVQPLIQNKMMYPSSGVLPAAKRVKNTGEITRWPMVEMTLTHRPAEYRMLDIPVSELQKHYKSVGLELEVEELETEEDNGAEEARQKLELELKLKELETQVVELEISL